MIGCIAGTMRNWEDILWSHDVLMKRMRGTEWTWSLAYKEGGPGHKARQYEKEKFIWKRLLSFVKYYYTRKMWWNCGEKIKELWMVFERFMKADVSCGRIIAAYRWYVYQPPKLDQKSNNWRSVFLWLNMTDIWQFNLHHLLPQVSRVCELF